jgi:PAS domain S-box-containing protein
MGKLNEVEAQLHLLSKALLASDQAVIITNREGVVEWTNPAFTKLTGYTLEEIRGKTPRILKSGRQDPAFYAELWRTISAKETWHGELINRRKDGQEYIEEMTISPVTDDNEEIAHFIAIKQDVTAVREAQKHLRQSERRYRTLVENLPDIVLRYDLQCRFVYASENVAEVFGIPAQAYIGQTPDEIGVSAGWSAYWRQNLHNVMATRKARNGEYLYDGENGRFYFYWRLVPEFDSKGTITGVLNILQDITPHYQNELLQKKQQAIARLTSSLRQTVTRAEMLPIILHELLSVMEASVVALLTPDLQTSEWVVEVSQGEHGYLVGARLPAENVLTEQIFAQGKPYLSNGTLADVGLSLQDEAGSIQAVVALPISIHGNELGIIWIGRRQPILPHELDLLTAVTDVVASALFRVALFEETQQQAMVLADRVRERTAALGMANTQLSEAMRSRDLFLASMSHELRTPLSVILMRAEILQDQIHGPLTAKQSRALEIIQQSAQLQLDLISDILDVAKIEAGQVTLDFETVLVRDICRTSLYMVQALAQQKHINITLHVLPEDLTICADARRLKQILVNLITNAVKFTPEKGKVGLLIDTVPDDEAIRFTVWDTGIGIKEGDIPKIFDPFMQIDNSLSKKYAGAGLGLALVLHLVKLHGGGIQVESEVNEGTRISFKLPHKIRKGGAPLMIRNALPVIAKNGNAANGRTNIKILLAEDNKMIADGLLDYFSTFDYEIVVAQNGVEALEQIVQFAPKLVLMDIHMPDMDGLEAIKRIRSNGSQTKGVPIIAMTGLAMPGDKERCLEAGATAYLPKPFSLTRLKSLMDGLLETAAFAPVHDEGKL